MNEILDEVHPLIGRGEVVDYIPTLAGVEPNQLGIAVCSRNGELFRVGDALRPSSIWNISKVFSPVQVTQHSGEGIWQRLGYESFDQPFNSLVQLRFERGEPHNPFINADVLMIYDINQPCFTVPAQPMRDFVQCLCGNPEVVPGSMVARSEHQHHLRDTAVAYLMKSFGDFHNDVGAVLLSYFYYYALRISCVDLARAFRFLADKGLCRHSGGQTLNERQTKQVNTTMVTSGLYGEAGDFAYRIDLPGKSGVDGGIIAIVPGRFTIHVWSPELNAVDGSLVSIVALEKLSERVGWSIS